MQRVMIIVLCALFVTACASEAPEQPGDASTGPMLELRVYFEGLVAFAPKPGSTTDEWLAILATAPGTTSQYRVPHSPEVFFSLNTVDADTGSVPAINIQNRRLTFGFEFAEDAPQEPQAFRAIGSREETNRYGKYPDTREKARSFFWTPSMSMVTGAADQGKLKTDWVASPNAAAAVLLDDGELATAALATPTCDSDSSLAIVKFAGTGNQEPRALSEALVLIVRKEIQSLKDKKPVVILTTSDLDGSNPDKPALRIEATWSGTGDAVMSVRIQHFPVAKYRPAVCTPGDNRTGGQHFDAFRTLAQSVGTSITYPGNPTPQQGLQPEIYKTFLNTDWHGIVAEIPRYPPICPPAVFE